MKNIHQLSLDEKHVVEIHGLGEIYQMASVENVRKKLRRKFGSGTFFLSSNSSHLSSLDLWRVDEQSDQGVEREQEMTLTELEESVRNMGYKILASGFVDSPPWQCRPRSDRSPLLRFALLAKLLFPLLVKLEPFREGEKKSHMVYVLGMSNGKCQNSNPHVKSANL